jgi:transposase
MKGASSYNYAEAQPSQELHHWIGGHVRAMLFFGGVTQIIVPDNLKQGVKSPCWYDPDLNQTYLDLAQHYGVAILPARVRKPRDKAKVEVGVQVVERWILARLRNRTFFSLAELNRAIRQLLEELNNRPMEHLEKSRRALFAELDQPALRPLPAQPYEYATYKTVRVNLDYHVEFEKHFNSVPHTVIHQEMRVRATERMVEIYHASKREPMAVHPRSSVPGRYSTLSEHMPDNHQKAGEWTPERLARWAAEIGPQTAALVKAILASRQHPEQAFRSCLGILRLAGKYPHEQMELACQIAHDDQTLNYRAFKSCWIPSHRSPCPKLHHYPPTKTSAATPITSEDFRHAHPTLTRQPHSAPPARFPRWASGAAQQPPICRTVLRRTPGAAGGPGMY